MKIVIQCAAGKRRDAGHLVASSGKAVDFVAHPQIAPRDSDREYARPDDLQEDGTSWRQYLVKYNDDPGENPLRLYRAYDLYENSTYRRLVDRFGLGNVYILSAGWGLIRADFLTPYYDITFSPSADAYKRRRHRADRYDDFRMLSNATGQDIVFFGGKDYVPLFCSLTDTIRNKKVVFFNSATVPQFQGCTFKRFETTTRTNWHYECANALIDGTISI
jgi:hypothetical protein